MWVGVRRGWRRGRGVVRAWRAGTKVEEKMGYERESSFPLKCGAPRRMIPARYIWRALFSPPKMPV